MTAFLAVLAGTLAVALVLGWARQRRLARRLLEAGHRLAEDVVAAGSGLDEATSLVERVIDRTVVRGDDVSLAEDRLASALMMIPQGVVVFDASGTIVFRNQVAA